MIKYLKILIIALCCIACKPHNEADKVDLSTHEIHFDREGGKAEVQVVATSFYRSLIYADWAECDFVQDDKLVITAAPNDSTSRSGKILFLCGSDTATLSLSQSHKDEFSILPESVNFSYRGGSEQIYIKCYTDWSVKKKSEWITAEPAQGSGPQYISIDTQQTESPTPITGEITFTSQGKDITVRIQQQARPFIKLERDNIDVDGDQSNISILYLTNTEVVITNENNWIRVTNHDTISRKLSLNILRNMEYAKRVGTIRFTSLQDTSIQSTLTINQGVKIDHPALGFEEGYTLNVSSRIPFTLHPIFTDMSDTTLIWRSNSPDIANVDQNGVVTVLGTGECRITITNTYHNVSAEILLKIRLLAESMTVMLGNQNMNINTTAVRFPGEKMTIQVLLHPENSYSGDIICFSSNPESVKTDGLNVECISEGTSTITVESLYNKLSYSFKIIVIQTTSSYTPEGSSLYLP
jgi:hypothetical protein